MPIEKRLPGQKKRAQFQPHTFRGTSKSPGSHAEGTRPNRNVLSRVLASHINC